MQIADNNQGLGNCDPLQIKHQLSRLTNENSLASLELYYDIAIQFSRDFQEKGVAKTGNISNQANPETNLRLFRICTSNNIRKICLKLFNQSYKYSISDPNKPIKMEKKTMEIESMIQENSKKLLDFDKANRRQFFAIRLDKTQHKASLSYPG